MLNVENTLNCELQCIDVTELLKNSVNLLQYMQPSNQESLSKTLWIYLYLNCYEEVYELQRFVVDKEGTGILSLYGFLGNESCKVTSGKFTSGNYDAADKPELNTCLICI